MNSKQIKVVIVDDNSLAIEKLKVLLQLLPDIEVVATFTNATKAIDYLTLHVPDIIFLDIEMPDKTGLETAEILERNLVLSKIIFVTSHDHYMLEAIRKNAFDYILKPVSLSVLKNALDRFKSKMYVNLTRQELSILRLIVQGNTSKEIASTLNLSFHTVNTHRKHLLSKTDCKNASELIQYALNTKLV